ncbi:MULTISPECIES: peptide chain release factor N(5)-glutamine methyltransferase [unclassified Acinetobacter]|uniref:peptide chain release factor N(5)-glutamine methyltransferase n=1 Tax=unclassified Acinetobacter TaxID=196816 RepID=UPI00293531E6|nr:MULTISPECIES: peptide chain release factor N(5)-glutamine methyltransferase [unclassified Acinetobacter]WOE32395.1 peptide chain release factor N(5)-glutamine methyltransferase [Acinetobacter sp. SAAs470]WOE37868.1 peptide chain release factor N(5)-glutamine methyltransferase [Acinetobacter sp. SAAs474]
MNIAQALSLRGEIDSYERQEAIWLLEHLLQQTALAFKYDHVRELSVQQQQDYLNALQRLDGGEPLAYIIGSQPFWTLDLKVTSDTLVPRPDTEILVQTVLDLSLHSHADVLDLGTGTGAIALALASERPDWQFIATDVYLPTLQVAQHNAQQHALTQVQFKLGSWFEALANDSQHRFDLIVSNPPYIDAADQHMPSLATEPQRALVAAKQGLADLELIIDQAQYWLKHKAWLVVEHGYDQAQAVQQQFKSAGYQHIRTIKDYGGNDRVSLGQWIG